MSVSNIKPKGFVSDRVASCVYVVFENSVLFLKTGKKEGRKAVTGFKWGPITGEVENMESSNETAIRELFEEAGIKAEVKDLILLGHYYYLGSTNVEFDDYCLLLKNKPNIVLSDEHLEYKWVPFGDVVSLDLVPVRREAWLHQSPNWDRMLKVN